MLAGIAALSLISGAVAGLLGAGGDILYVPLLLYALPAVGLGALDVHTIGALSLVQSMASTAGGGAVHYLDRRLDRGHLIRSAAPLALGALAGGLLSSLLAGGLLVLLFALITSSVIVLLALPVRPRAEPAPPAFDPVATGLLLATALICGIVGVGGGFLIVTILLRRARAPLHTAKGTALLLTVCTALPGLTGKIITGQLGSGTPVPVILAAGVVGGILGARISQPLPARALRWGLALLVGGLAARMWLTVITGGV